MNVVSLNVYEARTRHINGVSDMRSVSDTYRY